jgi:cobyrinic acid a,c-diamide synthase
MFHRAVTGIPSYNLDPFFQDGEGLIHNLGKYGGSLNIIEGAMGYYDGLSTTDECSAYTVALDTRTPVILVINAKGAGASLGAVIEGFTKHKKDSNIVGVIFNEASESRRTDLEHIAQKADCVFLGLLPRKGEWVLPGRHLGLLTVGEIENLKCKLLDLGMEAAKSINLKALIDIAGSAPDISFTPNIKKRSGNIARLAVARDKAFCFMYAENIGLLKALGCEIVFFSPLYDTHLPEGIDGLYLGGGYAEIYDRELSDNVSMRESIRMRVLNGLPLLAEGGGFLYLHDELNGLNMCGVIEAKAYETKRLQRFGYITLTANEDNLLCKTGESLRAHEFHYWESENPGAGFMAKKAGRDISYNCVHASESMYAGFPQIYFPGNIHCAYNFVNKMSEGRRNL